MTILLFVLCQVGGNRQWGEVSSRNFWQLYGAEFRKTSARQAPHAYALLLNGADKWGMPYQTENPRLSGWGDSVVSGCIRMDSIGPAYLSFAYQRGGYMEPPESDDTLILWGLNADGRWIPLWRIEGTGTADTAFEVVHLWLSDPQWLHPCFSLKWSVWGSTYGAYDNWFIGYTIIQRDTQPLLPVWTQLPRIYDRRYSVWPYAYMLRDSVVASVAGDGITPIIAEVRIDGRVIRRINRAFSPDGDSLRIYVPPASAAGRFPIHWVLYRGQTLLDSIVLVDTLILSERTWGYDDGEMEAGYGLLQPNRAFCQTFEIDTPQRLWRVGVRFFPLPTQYGKPFQLGIWDITNQAFTPLYIAFERVALDTTDGWQWFELDTSVVVRGKICIGFIQVDNQPLGIGWDANCGTTTVRIQSGGQWGFSELQGCMMVRIELAPIIASLANIPVRGQSRTIIGQRGEPIILPSELKLPLRVWDMMGRELLFEAELWHGLSAGMYVGMDMAGQPWRLIIVP
ncbi:MAG: hypothetical protein ABDH66_00515 [Bacteroidia bacterium]